MLASDLKWCDLWDNWRKIAKDRGIWRCLVRVTASNYNNHQGEKFPQNFISSRDGPVRSTKTRQKWKNVGTLPYMYIYKKYTSDVG